MKKIVQALAGGILLTFMIFLWCHAAALMWHDFSQPPGHQTALQKMVMFPFLWSTYLGEFVFPETYAIFSNTEALTYYVLGCNVLFYSFIAHDFWTLIRRLKKTEGESANAPNPPIFLNYLKNNKQTVCQLNKL